MSTAQAGSARKSRNDSPAPKAGSPKSAEALKKAAAEAALAAAKKPAEAPKVEEKTICGFHPEAFKVMIYGPLAVGAVIVSTLFFDVGRSVVAFVQSHWKTISVPVAKFMSKNGDTIVVLAAGAAFLPMGLVLVTTIFHATMDLHNFAWWQQGLLGLLVFVALATAWTVEGTLWTFAAIRTQWNKVSDPIEAILSKKADSILAGAAILCMAPIVAALLAYAVRIVWGCRLKIVDEEAKAPVAKAK